MKKIIVSASLATVAIHAFASIERKVDVSVTVQADAEVVAAIDAALQKREVAQSVSGLYDALMKSLSKDGKTLAEELVPEGHDSSMKLAWGDDSTAGFSAVCYGNCYSNCHGACHSACHGSRGWR